MNIKISKAAAALGSIKTAKKAAAARENGAKGGRPPALTKHLGLVPTGKYMEPNSGVTQTGSDWEADFRALSNAESEAQEWELIRVRKPRTAAEKETWGEWMEYDK